MDVEHATGEAAWIYEGYVSLNGGSEQLNEPLSYHWRMCYRLGGAALVKTWLPFNFIQARHGMRCGRRSAAMSISRVWYDLAGEPFESAGRRYLHTWLYGRVYTVFSRPTQRDSILSSIDTQLCPLWFNPALILTQLLWLEEDKNGEGNFRSGSCCNPNLAT